MLYKYKGEIPVNSNIVVREGTKSILSETFEECTNINSVTIPDTVLSIAENALKSNYKSMTIIGEAYSVAEQYAQEKELLFMDSESKEILHYDSMPFLKYVIIDDTVSIQYVNYKYTYKDTITMPGFILYESEYKYNFEIPERIDGLPVVSIEKVDGFIESVILPNSIKRIGDQAFEYCNLLSFKIPDEVTSIGSSVFHGCTSLKTIIIPSTVESIGYRSFEGCDNLTDVYFSGSEKEWNNIKIDENNFALIDATIHYNYTQIKGDVNLDGSLSVADVVLLQKWLLAVPDTKLPDWKAADLCEDGRLDVFDLCLMKRMLVENS